MLVKDGISLSNLDNAAFSQPWLLSDDKEVDPSLQRHIGSGSGGYADNIFKYAAKEIFGEEVQHLEYKTLRYLLLEVINLYNVLTIIYL